MIILLTFTTCFFLGTTGVFAYHLFQADLEIEDIQNKYCDLISQSFEFANTINHELELKRFEEIQKLINDSKFNDGLIH